VLDWRGLSLADNGLKYVFVWKQMYKTFEPTHSQIFDLSVIVRIISQIEDLAVYGTRYQAQIPL